ncbi:MAG: bifunctional methylenetetrahydrofolate dehydrogenase/methenyltetrahydrofolate cyclohydrolase FolD [Myxococcota bacterium]|nr:bifunctional methylenetetrahydrofolate dehydrogenase/methenyltetrahydrofolate cyclohydrolase FolD [Myxococcota bacterium]
MASLIDGKACAATIRAELAERVLQLQSKALVPRLVVLRVGDDAASAAYVRNKKRAAISLGMLGEELHFPEDTNEETLRSHIHRLNADPSVHGLMVQLPLPRQLDAQRLLACIAPEKDVDGLHPLNLGRLLAGVPALRPCTPRGIMELLRRNALTVEGLDAVVLGRSNIVGKPLALMLTAANATVTVCHTKTQKLREHVERAQLLVVAIGQPRAIPGDWIRPGAIVIDTGTSSVDGKLVGDVDFETARERAAAITPVPGGVGPMTIAMLLTQTVEVAERHAA